MAKVVFWQPYNEAHVYKDFRRLIEAIRIGDPMIMEPDVRKLIADQLEDPKSPSRRSKSKIGWDYVYEIMDIMFSEGVTEYSAIEALLDRRPNLNRKTVEGYVADYKKARAAHNEITE